MSKIKLGLDRMNPEQKVAFATTVITAMTGNAHFTTPNPPLATLTAGKNNALSGINTYNASVVTSQANLATRDDFVSSLEGMLTQMATYVENVSGGDRAMIESAGFSVRADSAPVGPLARVLNLVLTAGDFDGTLDAAWDALRGAGSYEVQTSPDPMSDASWVFKTVSNKSNVTMDSFTSGAKVWVKVRGIGAGNNKGPWSDPAVKTVP